MPCVRALRVTNGRRPARADASGASCNPLVIDDDGDHARQLQRFDRSPAQPDRAAQNPASSCSERDSGGMASEKNCRL
jgi:hypothetical protein